MSAGSLADLAVPLILLGLFLLAALAIGLLIRQARRSPPRPPTPAPSAAGVTLPMAPEAVTQVLTPVYLQLVSDPSRRFAIDETPFSVGRAVDNHLVIDETFPEWQTVSREHAIITRHPRGYVIEDRGSRNSVRVNGRLTPKNLLRNGWQVSVGGVTFRFVDETQMN